MGNYTNSRYGGHMMGCYCCWLVLVTICHPVRMKAFLSDIISLSFIQTTRGFHLLVCSRLPRLWYMYDVVQWLRMLLKPRQEFEI